ncbi:MAG: PQQ-dependent sugar dehydrogenase, partial [Chloroflexi bacterium]|nr:PQQ-dependent sugar dehydrogenase [Chloroflexota bacterium]
MSIPSLLRSRRILATMALTALVGACAGPAPTAAPWTAAPSPIVTTPAASPIPASPGESTTPTASAPSSSAAPDHPDLAGVQVALQTAASGLSAPLWATVAGDGSGRLFVAEQGGRIRVVLDGTLLATPFVDLSGQVAAEGERGLLGLAFAPGFGTSETRFYVHYSNPSGDTTIAELQATPGADTADTATERILLVEPQPYANHNGGWIGFDPGGMLLIGLGDGGSGGDPENRASRLDTLLGKILRLDVLGGATGGLEYGIPADNPFLGRSDARPEILHYGLRNPFRASVDPATGTLWIGDVGQNTWEEVDTAAADARGLDFGWHRWEGRHCYEPAEGCDPAGVTQPVTEYGHGAGCSVIGGVVYRGSAIPALRGAYLFSDYCSGTLWAIDAGLDAQQAP